MNFNSFEENNPFYAPSDYFIVDPAYPTYFHKLKYKIKQTKITIDYLESRINSPFISESVKFDYYLPELKRAKQSLKAFYNQGSYLSSA